jgi:AhpD family alkylhydroperoxidase
MQARINNPVMTIPGALDGLREFGMAARAAVDLPATTLELVHLRASQINGCSVCVDIHSRALKALGAADEQINTVATWRETPYFSEEERAALALAEAGTRLADNPRMVPDAVWDEAARLYSEQQLAALVVSVAAINAFNRLNVMTSQPTGPWTQQIAEQAVEAIAA